MYIIRAIIAILDLLNTKTCSKKARIVTCVKKLSLNNLINGNKKESTAHLMLNILKILHILLRNW